MTEKSTSLDRTALEARGIAGWPYGIADSVRFYEIDALNHVNNNAYLRWFENLRVRYFLDYGLSGYTHTDVDPQLVVRHQTADFLAPMHLHQPYTVVGRISVLKPTSMVLTCEVHSQGTIAATGETVMISLEHDGKTRRAHKPEAVQRIIAHDAPQIVA